MEQIKHLKIEGIKFLADVNVEKEIEKEIVDDLLSNGYNVKWIPDLNCKMLDQELLELAKRENRILITNDKDFGELTFRQKRLSTGIILLRVKGQETKDKVRLLRKLFLTHGKQPRNHFTVVSRKKVRFIPMEDII